jgi:dihydroneopterin aldolase
MAIISLENMEFYAYHGCFKEEQQIGTWFEVDLNIKTFSSKPEFTDNLADAVDYQSVYLTIKQEMMKKSKLLEHVARRILDAVMAKYSVSSVTVIIRKKNPPLGGKIDSVSVKLTQKFKKS